MVKISVVMPAYNAEKYVADAIESILNQTFTDFEFIIIDDRSTDNTWEIIKGYKDKRIKAFRNEKNVGFTKSIKKGIAKSKGDVIARMDADDISMPSRFEKQIKVLENGYDVVGSHLLSIDEKGRKIKLRKYKKNINEVIKIESPLGHPSTMYSKKSYESVGGYDESLNPADDYDLWLRLHLKGFKITNVTKPLLKYRLHEVQTKSSRTKITLKNTIKAKKNAKKKGLKLGLNGEIRLFLEKVLMLLPASVIVKLFRLIKG